MPKRKTKTKRRAAPKAMALLLVRPVGDTRPAYWPATSETEEAAWMTVDVEDGVVVGRTLGVCFEFGFPLRSLKRAIRTFLAEAKGDGVSWELRTLTVHDARPGVITHKRKRQ